MVLSSSYPQVHRKKGFQIPKQENNEKKVYIFKIK